MLLRMRDALADFPGYAKIRRIGLTLEPWTIENGLQTPTLKIKRNKVLDHCREAVERMYENEGPGA
jgi:long-chain acyl-CoA synthetase